MREGPVVQADDEDHRELQPLGRMQCEQRRSVQAFGEGVLIGDQGYLLQESGQPDFGELLGHAAQFEYVLPAVGPLVRTVIDVGPVARVLDDPVHQ